MARPEIVQYVKSYRAQGYAMPQVRDALRASGVLDSEIDDALAQSGASKRIPTSVIVIGVLGAIIIVLALIYTYVSSSQSTSSVSSISLKLSALSREVVPGESVSFVREVSRTGAAQAEVRIAYAISIDGVDVANSEESLRVARREAGVVSLRLPKDAAPGQYVVLADAKSGTQSSKASFALTVKGIGVQAPASGAACARSCDDFNPCTLDVCRDGACQSQALSPCCGNAVCESGEQGGSCEIDCRPVKLGKDEGPLLIKEQAVSVAKRSSDDSVALCRSLTREFDQDSCLGEVALTAGKSGICGQIAAEKDRDSCLMDFVVQKDEFVLCDEIADVWLKNSCVSYQRLKQQ